MRRNQISDNGVICISKRMEVVVIAKILVKRQRLLDESGLSSNATTTSLYAMPKLRSKKDKPEITVQVASDSRASGIRLIAALPIG